MILRAKKRLSRREEHSETKDCRTLKMMSPMKVLKDEKMLKVVPAMLFTVSTAFCRIADMVLNFGWICGYFSGTTPQLQVLDNPEPPHIFAGLLRSVIKLE